MFAMSIPILVGIVGHRNIAADAVPEMERELGQVLDRLGAELPHTAIVVVSSLAEGADRLGARLALARGLPLLVPLPFPLEQYERDFPNSVAEFRSLLAQASDSFVISEQDCSGYEAAARWLSRHAQVVVALWDGQDTESEAAPGGTAHTIRLRTLPGEAGHSLASVADYLGPTYHIDCPRQEPRTRQSPRWLSGSLPIPDWNGAINSLRPIERFNRSANPTPEPISTGLPAWTSLERVFRSADTLANQHQKTHNRALGATIVLAVAGYLLQGVAASFLGQLSASLFFLLALMTILLENKRHSYQIYLESRALAEVLRVAIYWRLAGVTLSPTRYFLTQHWGELAWIRSAVKALWATAPRPAPDLERVKSEWIDAQHHYYRRSTSRFGRLGHRFKLGSNILFAFALGLAVLSTVGSYFDVPYSELSSAFSGLLFLAASAASYYLHTRGLEEDALRYAAMGQTYGWVEELWAAASDADRQKVVVDLGNECIAELSHWLLAHRSRPLEFMQN